MVNRIYPNDSNFLESLKEFARQGGSRPQQIRIETPEAEFEFICRPNCPQYTVRELSKMSMEELANVNDDVFCKAVLEELINRHGNDTNAIRTEIIALKREVSGL